MNQSPPISNARVTPLLNRLSLFCHPQGYIPVTNNTNYVFDGQEHVPSTTASAATQKEYFKYCAERNTQRVHSFTMMI